MKVVGFGGDDFNLDQLSRLGVDVRPQHSVNGYLIAVPFSTYIDYGSYDEQRYRPHLKLNVEIHGAKGDFGNGVTEFRYRPSDRFTRSIQFDFTDAELGELATKGLFHPDFQTPDAFTDTELEIPMELSVTTLDINGKMFAYADFDKVSDIRTNSKDSEYNLAAYFEHQSLEPVKEEDTAELARQDVEAEHETKELIRFSVPAAEIPVQTVEKEVVEETPVEETALENLGVEEVLNNEHALDEIKEIVQTPQEDSSEAETEAENEDEDEQKGDEQETAVQATETAVAQEEKIAEANVPDAVTAYDAATNGGALGPDFEHER